MSHGNIQQYHEKHWFWPALSQSNSWANSHSGGAIVASVIKFSIFQFSPNILKILKAIKYTLKNIKKSGKNKSCSKKMLWLGRTWHIKVGVVFLFCLLSQLPTCALVNPWQLFYQNGQLLPGSSPPRHLWPGSWPSTFFNQHYFVHYHVCKFVR